LPDGFFSNKKIPIWVNFGGAEIGKYLMAIWNLSQPFGKFNDHLVHFVLIWYIFPVLVSCTKKNLATLAPTKVGSGMRCDQEPILRLLNLQLQRQRCSRLERFSK
jgi:hypothetical protein